MKKVLKIFAIVIFALLVLMIVIPLAFHKPIMNKAREEINKTLKARVDFDLRLSLIKGFPDLFVELRNLTVTGIDQFEGDTLIAFRSFGVKVNLISAIRMKDIDIKSVILDKPYIHAIVLEDGKANWDIMKDTTTAVPVDTTPSEPVHFSARLRKLQINDGFISYDDRQGNMQAVVKGFDFLMKGNLASDFTSIVIKTSADAVTFIMDKIPYLSKARLSAHFDVDADMVKSLFTLKDNAFSLNELTLGWEGTVGLAGDSILTDVKFATKKTDFRSILSLVPAVYTRDFASVQTSGQFQLDGQLKGVYYDTILPSAMLNLEVTNGRFRYPDLPASVENIQINTHVDFHGENMDLTTVEVKKFHLELAGNPLDISLHVARPISDPMVDGLFKGVIDLGKIQSVIPLDSTTLAGIITSDVSFGGTMSMLEKEQYEQFKADGNVAVNRLTYKSPDLPQGLTVKNAELLFSPRYLDLKSFNLLIGRSDMQLSGKITDFLPYVFSNKTIKGNFVLTSGLLDANEFMTGSAPADTVTDTTQMTLFEVPKNIDFALNSNLKKVLYDKLEISDIKGLIELKNGAAKLTNLSMNLLQGSMQMNGEYNTSNLAKPFIDFNLKINDIDIPSSFDAFSMVARFAPVAKNAKGKVSAGISLWSQLDQHMSPVLPTVSGSGTLSSRSVEIGNSRVFEKLADALKNDKFRQIALKDVNIGFDIKDGRVYVKPFTTKMGNTSLTIAGDQGLDQTLNYTMALTLPRTEIGSSVMNSLTSAAAAKGIAIKPSETINVKVKVGGTFADPKVQPDLAGSGENVVSAVKEQVKEKVNQAVEEKKEAVKAEVSKKADELVAKAEAEAQQIRDAARKAADLERQKANELAEKTLKEAEGKPLAMPLAKKTAEKIRKEGEEKAQKIIKEADQKADAIVEKARSEADKLKQ
ncbi:MAG: AsmA family protein [Bacteroidales bacterium]|nr:AsmA family protein [Bacteroidales bacterium]